MPPKCLLQKLDLIRHRLFKSFQFLSGERTLACGQITFGSSSLPLFLAKSLNIRPWLSLLDAAAFKAWNHLSSLSGSTCFLRYRVGSGCIQPSFNSCMTQWNRLEGLCLFACFECHSALFLGLAVGEANVTPDWCQTEVTNQRSSGGCPQVHVRKLRMTLSLNNKEHQSVHS